MSRRSSILGLGIGILGLILLNVPAYAQAPVNNGYMEFSLDIGSDTELSDPQADGDEGFDPGDVYWWQGPPVMPPGRDGFKDDNNIFINIDPIPDPPNSGGVPVGMGTIEEFDFFFDLDGHDQLEFQLIEFIDPAIHLLQPIPMGQIMSNCIFQLENLAISFDDDEAPSWPANNVPVTAPSPLGIVSYGMTQTQDEVLGLNLMPMIPGQYSWTINPFADEMTVHPSMAPNPDSGTDQEDDDVDSLDIVCMEGMEPGMCCPFWYFTADHEANYGLDPGDIYMVTGTGPQLVINESVHLGISEETDIDAFEFVSMESEIEPGMQVLAIIFSVDDDDPLTQPNESGGLNPKQIYYSFMTGWSAPLLFDPNTGQELPLEDDVDAITNWMAPFMYEEPCDPPFIVAADSLVSHGGAMYPVNILSNDTEPRLGGPQQIVITFQNSMGPVNIQAADGLLDTEVTLSNGAISGLAIAGNQLIVNCVAGSFTDDICLRITVQGISELGKPMCLMQPNPTVLGIRLVAGDVNNDGSVNVLDVILTKQKTGTPVGPTTFRFDVAPDNTINVLDVIRVKQNTGGVVSLPCP